MANHRDYVMTCFNKFLEKNKFEPQALLLDVGCRNEELERPLRSLGFDWVGQDLHAGRGVSIVCPMENMEAIESNTYDLIFCCHALEHCERPVEALREFKRVLKNGGKVFIATPNPCKRQIPDGDHDHIFVLYPEHWLKLMEYVGFSDFDSHLDKGDQPKEQDWNVITTGVKNE